MNAELPSFFQAERDDLGLRELRGADGNIIGYGVTTTRESRAYRTPFIEGDEGRPVEHADVHLPSDNDNEVPGASTE